MRQCLLSILFAGLCVATVGCGSAEVATESSPTQVSDSSYLTTSEPGDAIPVGDARQNTQDGQEATLIGIIGGSSEPFVDGLAAFTIVDPKVPYCAPDEGCPTPWDYCCTQDQVKDNIATVKLVDETGSLVEENAQGLLGVKELSRVVVSGTVKRDDQGNLTLAAKKVFVTQ